ncbi:MAG: hypothetical protein HOA61_00420 [Bacteroidetes bacterium]|nr:hypothetical protein [Bacteroidota bacterium]
MKRVVVISLILFSGMLYAQTDEDKNNEYKNASSVMLDKEDKLTIGGYGQVDYNQKLSGDEMNNGKMDVHRLVILFGYKFNERTSFVTELEFEHVSEVYVEQAFLNYKINDYLNFRSGLLLIPMGIINEYHEPNTFNGVERPNLDSRIAPTTWREIGAGFSGKIQSANIKYQAYVVNGFNGYDGSAKFSGSGGLRSGRQKAAESYISSPNYTSKVEFYGIRGLNLGLSGYFGNSQSTLYQGVDKSDANEISIADSSVIGLSMFGFDARYKTGGFMVRGQYYLGNISNSVQYNEFTGSDVGASLQGYYIELGYDVLRHFDKCKTELIPFVRYENYNTQNSVSGITSMDLSNNRTEYTFGLGWKVADGAMIKADLQLFGNESNANFTKQFNAGIAVGF